MEKWRFLEDWVTYSGHTLVSGRAEPGSHVCLGHISLTRARDGPPDHAVHFLWAVLGHRSILVSCSTVRKPQGPLISGASRLGLREVHRGTSSNVSLVSGFAINWGRAEWNERSAHPLGSVPGRVCAVVTLH